MILYYLALKIHVKIHVRHIHLKKIHEICVNAL